VSIQVFTTAFRKVSETNLGQFPQGTNTLSLPTDDNWGTPLANGLYYLVIHTPSDQLVVKLLVMR